MIPFSRPISIIFSRSTANLIGCHFQIAKTPLCLLVAFSALFGYILAPDQIYYSGMLTFAGVFSLACGAASLNSLQEYKSDRLMERTRDRPLAKGILAPAQALLQARLLLLCGFIILYAASNSIYPVIAGVCAVIIYNFIYTPLKNSTIWALVPGAICGALPPYIGWLAGNGFVLSPVILTVFALFAVWQIPHFWLILLANRSDYLASKYPNLIQLLSERSLQLVSVVWLLSALTIVQNLVALLNYLPDRVRWIISIFSVAVFIIFCAQMFFSKSPAYRFLFFLLNGFMFLIMLLFSIGSLGV